MATSVMSAATRTPGFIAVSGRRAVAHSPYGLPIIDNCTSCKLRKSSFFCTLAQESIDALDHVQHSHCFSEGSVVFLEGQQARGVYILCQGRAKLMTTNTDGKSVILKIAEPGTILGLHSAINGGPYEVTVENPAALPIGIHPPR